MGFSRQSYPPSRIASGQSCEVRSDFATQIDVNSGSRTASYMCLAAFAPCLGRPEMHAIARR